MRVEPGPSEGERNPPAAVEATLRALLVGELSLNVDPLTGQIVDGEKSPPLTEPAERHTIP